MKKPVFSKNVIVPAIAVISGFAIRVLGYDWGRPAIYQPDEAKMVHPVLDMARNHSIISYNYLYPDQFMSKIQALALMAYNRISGIGLDESLQAYWICRIITALCGAATVLIVYLLGEKLYKNVGTISAFLAAVSPYMVVLSKQVTGDVVCLMGSAITMLFALKYAEDLKYRYIALMTLGSAVAMLEKWHGGGGTVFVALFILIYSKSIKDFFVRGVIALFSFAGWILVLAPNVLLNPRTVYTEGFLSMAVHDGETASFIELFRNYAQWGFIHVGGVLYLIAFIAGAIIAISRKDKRYCVLLFGLIKAAEMSLLNRAVERWGLELYLSEIICIAICIEWLYSHSKVYLKVISVCAAAVIMLEGLSASVCIDLVAMRDDQDIRVKQEMFCVENGITAENSISSYYSAFSPGGYRPGGESERAEEDRSNVFVIDNGKLVRTTDKNYFVWTNSEREREKFDDRLEELDLCIWSDKQQYYDVFTNPIQSIEHSWNDIKLIANNMKACKEIADGATIGRCDIKVYDISSVPISRNTLQSVD